MANEILVVVKEDDQSNFDSVNAALETVAESARRSTETINKGFERARDSLGRFVKQGEQSGERAFDGVKKGASTATRIVQDLANAFTRGLQSLTQFAFGTGPLGALILSVGGLGAAATGAGIALVALAPAISSIAGVAGAAATALVGMGAALAVLKIGFGGIGEALSAHGKQMKGAGSAAVDTSEQQRQAALRIRDAARAVEDAKRREERASRDVNRARLAEIERLEDLEQALKMGKVSQAEAAQAVVEAEERNRRAQEAGSDWEKAEAANALARAKAEYDGITENLDDLTKEKEKAKKVGIDGSDQVQDALEREAEAHEQVVRAQERLTEARRKSTVATAGAVGGINAFDEAMAKLSPNAQKLVRALIDIKERFDDIKRRVQDRLLAGFDKEVTDLADKWLPVLDRMLLGIADRLNNMGKQTMRALGEDTFIENIEKSSKSFEGVIDDITIGATHLIDAFGRISRASAPVLKVISGTVRDIFVWFDKWIKKADETGQLDSFMEGAAETLQRIFDIGEKVFGIIGKLIEIIFPQSADAAESAFDKVERALDKVSDWLGEPENQKKVEEFVDTVISFLNWLFTKGIPTVTKITKALVEFQVAGWKGAVALNEVVNKVKSKLADAWNWLYDKAAGFFNWLSRSASKVGGALGGMWAGIKEGFRSAINWIIARWNNLSFSIPGGDFFGLPSLDTPDINFLASGGIGNGLTMVGERGRELLRLPAGTGVIPNGATERMLQESTDARQMIFAFANGTGNRLMDAIIEGLRLYIKGRGGDVQVALGRGGPR